MADLEDVRAELIDLWGRLAPLWGITPAAGRIYAALLARDEALDGDSLAEELGMSRGAVSMGARELVEWGLVHPERTPGSRRVGYRAETDLERAIRSIVQTRKRREWDPILESVRDWSARLAGLRSKEAGVLRERLSDLEGMVAMVDSLAAVFLRGGTLQRLGLKTLVSAAGKRRGKARP